MIKKKNSDLRLLLCFGSDGLGNTPNIHLDFCEDLIEVLHFVILHRVDLRGHISNVYARKKDTKHPGESETYVFERRRHRFGFVLVLQVLVRHMEDVLLFLPLLFILPHVT